MCGYYVQSYWDYEQRNQYLCYIEAYLIYPMAQISFIVPAILLMRYLSIIRIRYQKILQYNEDDSKFKLPIQLILLKQLGSPWVLIIFPVIIYVTSSIVLTIAMAVNSFKCSKFQDSLFVYWHGLVSTVLAIFYMGLALYDYISNGIEYLIIKKCQVRKFIQSDQFYFRFETFFSFGMYVIFIVFLVTDHPDLIHFALSSLMNWYVLFPIVITPLVVSIVRYFLKKFRNKKKVPPARMIYEMYGDPELMKLFEKFSKKEYSVENYLFKVDYDAYKKLTNSEAMKHKAQELLEKFFSTTSSYELNVSGKGVGSIHSKLSDEESLPTLFDSIMNEVEINLADTYSRFIIWHDYEVLMQNRELKKQMGGVSSGHELV